LCLEYPAKKDVASLSELGWWMQLGKQLKIVIIFVFVFFNVLT
jgi:hypothetical protein